LQRGKCLRILLIGRHNFLPDFRKALTDSSVKPVLRIWRVDWNFASYYCARCGEKGHARGYGCTALPDPVMVAKAKAEV
jgi:hypothetical protein